LIILAITVAMLFGIREGVRYTLIREVDQLLLEDTQEITFFIERFHPSWALIHDELDRKARGHAAREWFGEIVDQNNQIVSASDNLAELQVGEKLDRFRTVERRFQPRNAPAVTIRVGVGLEMVKEDLDRLSSTLFLAGLGMLALAPLGGYFLAGRATRPLARIIRTTSRLRPRHLDERLPLRHNDDELDQLSLTINGFLDRIAAYLGQHREFLANVAHELRSPLAAMATSIEVALMHDRDVDQYRELLGSIDGECQRLGVMVQQLLLLAESDAGRLEPAKDRVELGGLARKSTEMFEGVAEQAGLKLEVVTYREAWIRGDAGQLRRVLHNLIDNALRYTPSGGLIEVSVNVHDEYAVIAVRDTGVGIPKDDVPFVFDRFYRGDKARTRGGTGLGLSICQAIVMAHGGTISVVSGVGEGTTMTLVFPAMPSDSEA